MKILSIVGARPQFVKVAVLDRALGHYEGSAAGRIDHRLLHTGQHHDADLSDVFFKELSLPEPYFSLGIGSGKQGIQTAAMMASIESSLEHWRPDVVVIYGDTNSTLAGALVASKMHIPLVHIEAGLRSFDRKMPEEINRIVSDHLSDLLLCPTYTALKNLEHEGRQSFAQYVGDVMLDAVQFYAKKCDDRLIDELNLQDTQYALVTLHRAANTDDAERLHEFVEVLTDMPIDVVLPMHPRLRKCLGESRLARLQRLKHVHLIGPASYLEMLSLEQHARLVMTDSGGVQKEAYFLGARCLTLRDETEWTETLHDDWNQLVGLHKDRVLAGVARILQRPKCSCQQPPKVLESFGGGRAGSESAKAILKFSAGYA